MFFLQGLAFWIPQLLDFSFCVFAVLGRLSFTCTPGCLNLLCALSHCWFCLPDLLCACLMRVHCVSFQLFLRFHAPPHISRLSFFLEEQNILWSLFGVGFLSCSYGHDSCGGDSQDWNGIFPGVGGWGSPSLTVAVSCLKQLWPWKLKDCWSCCVIDRALRESGRPIADRSSGVAPVSIHRPDIGPQLSWDLRMFPPLALWQWWLLPDTEGANSCSSSCWIMCGLQRRLL